MTNPPTWQFFHNYPSDSERRWVCACKYFSLCTNIFTTLKFLRAWGWWWCLRSATPRPRGWRSRGRWARGTCGASSSCPPPPPAPRRPEGEMGWALHYITISQFTIVVFKSVFIHYLVSRKYYLKDDREESENGEYRRRHHPDLLVCLSLHQHRGLRCNDPSTEHCSFVKCQHCQHS